MKISLLFSKPLSLYKKKSSCAVGGVVRGSRRVRGRYRGRRTVLSQERGFCPPASPLGVPYQRRKEFVWGPERRVIFNL